MDDLDILYLTDEQVKAIKKQMRIVMADPTEHDIFERRTFRLRAIVDLDGKRDGLHSRWMEVQETCPLPTIPILETTARIPSAPMMPLDLPMEETEQVECVTQPVSIESQESGREQAAIKISIVVLLVIIAIQIVVIGIIMVFR